MKKRRDWGKNTLIVFCSYAIYGLELAGSKGCKEMIKGKEVYPLKGYKKQRSYRYLFTSEGKKTIVKVVEYCYVGSTPAGDIFNLGFGNYIAESNSMVADVISNNGDAYEVFNTVLSTIPIFFKMIPNALIIVRGSDSDPSFSETCRKTALKNAHRNVGMSIEE